MLQPPGTLHPGGASTGHKQIIVRREFCLMRDMFHAGETEFSLWISTFFNSLMLNDFFAGIPRQTVTSFSFP